MITIAICDDEKRTADQVKKLASGFFREKNMEANIVCFSGGEELLKYNKNIDILFRHPNERDGRHGDGTEAARPEL